MRVGLISGSGAYTWPVLTLVSLTVCGALDAAVTPGSLVVFDPLPAAGVVHRFDDA